MRTGAAQDIEHKQGQVLLVDFWATWCPPCQQPMQHNEDMVKKNKGTWGDKVRIIGVSINKTKDEVPPHLKTKGWDTIEQFHRASSTSSQDYKV